MATLTKFVKDPEYNEIIAFFPQLNFNKRLYGLKQKTCYTHIGQHSSCTVSYINNDCVKATKEEYTPLLKELQSIGYNVKICK